MNVLINDQKFLSLLSVQHVKLSSGLIDLFREQGEYDAIELLVFSSCCINLLIQTWDLPEDKVVYFVQQFSLHEMMDISMRTKIDLDILTALNSERFLEYAPLIHNMLSGHDNGYNLGVCVEGYLTGKEPNAVETTMRTLQIFGLINATEAAILPSIS